ncbi:MAG: septum formation protein Maf [Clostridia bacterium]|nr:septum formation protein Maf [Clostridia bacterium]
MKLILASRSPRRKELLKELCPAFEVCPALGEEKTDFSLPACEVVKSLAFHKAKEVAALPSSRGAAVLGADTVVALDGRILGKPKDEEDAFEMLSALSGRVHEVFTGVCLLCPAGDAKEKTALRCARTLVECETLSEAFIRAYIASGSPMDKAGAYGIQDGGLVRRIEGSYSNVVGLPLELLGEMLKDLPLS